MADQTVIITDKDTRRRNRPTTDGPTRELFIPGDKLGASANVYANGEMIGNLIKLQGALQDKDGYTTLMSAMIHDLAQQGVNLEVIIFASEPSATTFTDGDALAINPADLIKIKASEVVDVSREYDGNSIGIKGNIGQPIKGTSDLDLWVCFVARGAMTLTENSLSAILEFFG